MEDILFKNTTLFDAMKHERASHHEDEPGWLKEARRQDIARLAEISWPTIKNEEWKYTNLALISKRFFRPVTRAEGVMPSCYKDYFIPGAINLVFVNGLFSEQLSFLDHPVSGVTAFNGAEALKAVEKLKSRMFELTKNDAELFLSLNRVLFKDLLYLEIDKSVQVSEPIHIIHLLDGVEGQAAAVFPRTFIKLNSLAEVAILETYVCLNQGEYFSNPVTEIILETDASCEYVQAHQHSPDAFHVGSTRVWQDTGSRFKSFVYTNGARVFRNNFNVLLQGEGAESVVNGLHALKGDCHADSHTFLDHIAPHSKSNQLYKCILEGKSHSVFNGKILVRREAQLTNSYQLNKNLLLSSECRVDTKPQLEIFADDVKCTHGATIGQLNEDELFYLETRGLNKEDASRMLIRGFIDDVLNQIGHPDVKSRVARLIS